MREDREEASCSTGDMESGGRTEKGQAGPWVRGDRSRKARQSKHLAEEHAEELLGDASDVRPGSLIQDLRRRLGSADRCTPLQGAADDCGPPGYHRMSPGDRDPNGHAHAHKKAIAYAHAHAKQHADGYTYADRNLDATAYAHVYAHRYSNAYVFAFLDAYADAMRSHFE